ncbi:TPA: terminase family protein [Streptococcus suis]
MSQKKIKSIFEEREENLMTWCWYWRMNMHKFVEDYLQIKLHFFQKLLIFYMSRNPYFMFIASRGLGKSWLTAVYIVSMCILYPGTNVLIASGVKNQARLVISEKIVALMNRSYPLRLEIEDIKTGVNNAEVKFKNGSKIVPITSSDNSRGYRANVVVLDEFRLIDYSIIDKVIKPMKGVPRQPEFKNKYPNKYKDYFEPNYEIYLSSAWFKTHWSFNLFEDYLKKMLEGRPTFVCALPYQVSLTHGLLLQSEVDEIVSSDMFNQFMFQMEYEAMFAGGDGNGFFQLDDINPSTTVTKAFVPPSNLEYLENKQLSKPRNLCNIPKVEGEIRLVSLDIALSGSDGRRKNDSSAFICMRMIPKKVGYHREAVYVESIHEAIESETLAIRFKRLFYDFMADYAVMDVNGIGQGVYDACAGVLRDSERDVEYEAWSAINDKAQSERYKYLNGKPVVYAIKANARLNNDIAVALRTAFQNKKISLLISDVEKRDELVTDSAINFLNKTPLEQQEILMPYLQTSLLVTELVSLRYEMNNGNIKIVEVGSATKDRYSALAYVNYIAQQLETDALNEDKQNDGYSSFVFDFGWKGR